MSEPVSSDTQTAPDFAAFEASENAKALGHEPPAATPAPDADADPEDAEPAAAATEPPAAQSTAAAPAPEKPVSKRQQQINDLIRDRALADERAAKLEAQIAELRATRQPAAEPKAKEPAAELQRALDPKDPEPIEGNFDNYGAFVRELARWEVRQDKRDAAAESARTERATAEQSAREEHEKTISGWVARRDAFMAKDPTFQTKAMPFLDGITPGTPFGDVLIESPVGPELALYLATHPEEVTRIGALHPIHQLRALGKLEARFDSETTSTSASAGPAAKTVTTAPAPPTTLAARSADPADPVAAAVARGDFSAFEAAENRKALASHRR